MVVFAVLFVLLAVLNFCFPAFGWYLRYGWMVKGHSEPSNAYILMCRISSVLALILFFVFLYRLYFLKMLLFIRFSCVVSGFVKEV